MKTNCPNCGAVITGSKCEYCGTRFDEENSIEKCSFGISTQEVIKGVIVGFYTKTTSWSKERKEEFSKTL